MKNEIYFIPNFGVAKAGNNNYILPKSDKKLLEKLLLNDVKLVVLAMELSSDDEFLDAALCDDNTDYKILGEMHDKKNFLGKIFNYISSTFYIVKNLLFSKKSTLVYIYFPGNISIIASIVSIVLGKKYSLYIRGSWSHSKLSVLLSGFIFKRARWVLVTGSGFCNQVSYFNKNVHPVSPMIAFSQSVVAKTNYSIKNIIKLLFVGHIRESKGIYDVLGAVEFLSEANSVELTIVGGGDAGEINYLRNVINEKGLSKNVNYVGHISNGSELSEYFTGADVFVYPSYFAEGFPRVVYEAMLHGLPICCTILEGMKGFMIDEKNCLEVESKNYMSVSNKIKQFVNDRQLRENVGNAACSDVNEYIKQFNEADHADQVLERL